MSREVDPGAIGKLVTWLVEGAPPSADGRKIVAQICEKLNAAGVPVDLFRLFIFTIHPTVMGRRLQWSAATGTKIVEAPYSMFATADYTANPLPHVMKTKASLRRRLVDPACPHDYKVVDELIADGFTDYLIQPVIYIDGEVHTMSWTTRHPEGFTDAAIAALESVRAPISRLVESYILRLNAENIISTYVGRDAGAKVLKGQIKRGDAEQIEAIILFADLKGFTEFSSNRPVGEVLERLNRFFDALEAPIAENGGEILKFMGDGLLAIFVLRTPGQRLDAARGAHLAVAQARANLAGEAFGFRSALHAGQLSYGNMGGSRRLDFTAIGAAVNLAARLLGSAAKAGSDDVMSAEFLALLGRPGRLLAKLPLKGIAGKTGVYAVDA